MTSTRVLVLGDVMRDIIVRAAGRLRRGTDQRAATCLSPGGSGANQAVWLAHFGVSVRFLGCVGFEDHAGETERLRVAGVEPVLLAHPDLPTGTLVAVVHPDGERSFLTDRGANDGLHLDNLDAVLAGIGHVHLSGYALVADPTRSTALALLDRAAQAGLPVSVDPGSEAFIEEVGAEALLRWVGGRSLCVVNAAEATALTGTADPQSQLRRLAERFDTVLLKRGAQGAMALDRSGEACSLAASATQVIDTIGAGDAFLAAFLAARFGSQPLLPCLERAIAAGTQAVRVAGGRPRATKPVLRALA